MSSSQIGCLQYVAKLVTQKSFPKFISNTLKNCLEMDKCAFGVTCARISSLILPSLPYIEPQGTLFGANIPDLIN